MVFARLGSNKVKQLSHVKPITQQLLLLLRLASSRPVPTSGHPTPAATCPICQGPRHCQQSMLQLGRLPTKWSDLSRRNSDSRIPCATIDWNWYSLWISPMSWYKAAFPRGKLQARNTKAVSWSVLVCLDQVSIWDLQRLEHFTLIRTFFVKRNAALNCTGPWFLVLASRCQKNLLKNQKMALKFTVMRAKVKSMEKSSPLWPPPHQKNKTPNQRGWRVGVLRISLLAHAMSVTQMVFLIET